MTKYKILCGCSVRQDPVVLAAYLRSLKALVLPPDTTMDFCFVNDGDGEEQSKMLADFTIHVLPATPRPPDATYGVNDQTHHWVPPTFEHLALQKQRIIDYALTHHYTHVFFVDSDLLLEPTTLRSLWSAKGSIVSGVFWTAWQRGSQPMPQTWLTHPYALMGLGMEEHEYIGALADRQLVRVLGGGACMLVTADALRKGVRYHPRLTLPEGGMWQGEDRTFAICAQRLHERQLADGWPDIFHAYHPDQRTPEALEEAWTVLSAPRQEYAKYGDTISITIDPLEDPQLLDKDKMSSITYAPEVRSFRGRLGGLKLAPELEVAVLDMRPGDTRLIDINFPYWSEFKAYRNRSKMVKLTLVDIKPYSYAPVLHEAAFAGVGA